MGLHLPAAVLAAFLLTGCAGVNTIVPPAEVRDPAMVLVLDHGRHTSLVLPHPEGSVRYAYGERDWYARMETGALEGLSALFRPTPAVLGRRLLPGADSPVAVRRAVGLGIEALLPVRVERARVEALRAELEALYRSGRNARIDNPRFRLSFVPHPEPYSLGRNSNHQVARWLERLGCRIEGHATWARWRLAPGASPSVGRVRPKGVTRRHAYCRVTLR